MINIQECTVEEYLQKIPSLCHVIPAGSAKTYCGIPQRELTAGIHNDPRPKTHCIKGLSICLKCVEKERL